MHVPLHCWDGNLQNLCYLRVGHAGEQIQLHCLALARIETVESIENCVQLQQFIRAVRRRQHLISQSDPHRPASPLGPVTGSRMIDQDLPHRRGRDGEELRAVLRGNVRLHQPEIRLVNQRRRLQGMTRALGAHQYACAPMQLVVNERHQGLLGFVIPPPPVEQQIGDGLRIGLGHFRLPGEERIIPLCRGLNSVTSTDRRCDRMNHMDPKRWQRLGELFEAARQMDAGPRSGFLDESCGDDADLRHQVEMLLRDDSPDEGTLENIVSRATVRLPATSPKAGHPIGAYRLVRELGHGGMGEVWLAVRSDDAYKKEVAIKLMQYGLHDPHLQARFRGERQILASLEHPNIARLIDGGTTDDGIPYVVMERVEGRPIDRYCDEERLNTRRRLELFRKVCDAASYAHRNLVVHRDIKPGNILVDSDGIPKLLDFGIAKLLDSASSAAGSAQTGTMMPLLTPEYASPEQVRGDAITTSSDIYSLGVLLYELLTGHRPYRLNRQRAGDMERVICEQAPERPSTAVSRDPAEHESTDPAYTTADAIGRARRTDPGRLRRILHGDLDNIVLMAMRKEPDRRYASVDLLAEDIRRHLEGLPVAARPGTWLYHTGKFIHRHRAGVAATVVGILSIVSVIGFYTARLQRERNKAETEARTNARVTDFLVELFENADPTVTGGLKVNARELLDRGADRIERELEDEPRVQSRMLKTMGIAYQNLGQFERSLELADAALKLQEGLPGDRREETVSLLDLQGELQTTLADYDAARASLKQSYALAEQTYGRHHEVTILTLANLGVVEEVEGNLDKAETIYRDALHLARTLPAGPDNDATRVSLNALGKLRAARGDHEEGVALLREFVALQERMLDEDSPQRFTGLNNLALVLWQMGDHAAAEPLYLSALELARRIFGDTHTKVAIALNNLGNLYKTRGDPDRAEPLLREALEIRRRLYGEEHPEIAQALNNLANVQHDRGELDEAEFLHRHALAIYRRFDDPDMAASLNNLASLLQEKGDYTEAEQMYRESLLMDRRTFGGGHKYVAQDMRNLATLLIDMERHSEAEPMLLEALALQEGNPTWNPLDRAGTMYSLGRLLTETDRAEEAEPLLRESLSIRRKGLTTGAWLIAAGESQLGGCLLILQRHDEAHPLLEEGYATLQRELRQGHPEIARAGRRLADLYRAIGENDLAAEIERTMPR